jgi:hypothetical protein
MSGLSMFLPKPFDLGYPMTPTAELEAMFGARPLGDRVSG